MSRPGTPGSGGFAPPARYPAIMRVLEVGVAEEERSTRYRGIERPKNAYAWLTRESSYERGCKTGLVHFVEIPRCPDDTEDKGKRVDAPVRGIDDYLPLESGEEESEVEIYRFYSRG